MVWLYGQAKFAEDMYNKPANSGVQISGEDDEENDSKYDKAFGQTKQTNKKDTKTNFDDQKKAQLKKLEELK